MEGKKPVLPALFGRKALKIQILRRVKTSKESKKRKKDRTRFLLVFHRGLSLEREEESPWAQEKLSMDPASRG